MRIRSFSSTLNFAITTLNEDKADDNVNLEKNFNEIMEKAAAYIRKIVAENFGEEEISESDLNTLILEDYNRVVDETYQNTDIPVMSMKYIAVKYLTRHRDEIPALLNEIDERGLKYTPDESYSDDFHENLIYAVLAIKDDYREYCENMRETNPEFQEEIEELVSKYGKVDAFKRYCEKYSNMKMIPFQSRRQIVSYGYLSIFGIEGLDESALSGKAAVLKYKKANYIKDYVTTYLERLEPMYREELENAVISRFCQLDQFGEVVENLENHNTRMRRIGLPGLGYFIDDNPEGTSNFPKIKDLMNKEILRGLDIDVLLRMNSFYNNRLAKVINDYSMAIFVLDNLNLTKEVQEGKNVRREDLPEGVLDGLMVKYQTLILPIKSFYVETQREIEENPNDFNENVQEIESDNDGLSSKKQVVLSLEDFIGDIKKAWKGEYTAYFNEKLPGIDNDLRRDVFLTNVLYNPVFLSYRFKNMALKSEYAHLHFMSQEKPDSSLNYGVVLSGKEGQNINRKTVLLASDGGLNLPNRLHTLRRDFSDFLISYTGTPLARVYEGFNDFFVTGEYVSSQVLLPFAKQHSKYIKDIKRGKTQDNGDKISRINTFNEKFVDHIMYCADSSQFMKSHKITTETVDKKGRAVKQTVQPVRYVDLTSGKIYMKNEKGVLVDKDGIAYGKNVEKEDMQEER